jgi:hypothetical protein
LRALNLKNATFDPIDCSCKVTRYNPKRSRIETIQNMLRVARFEKTPESAVMFCSYWGYAVEI